MHSFPLAEQSPKCRGLMTINHTVSTEYFSWPCSGINSIFKYLKFTMAYIKHLKSTEKNRADAHLEDKEAAGRVKPPSSHSQCSP